MSTATYRFCVPCCRREALHLDGVCSMSHTHPLATCRCGRPCTGPVCDECAARNAVEVTR